MYAFLTVRCRRHEDEPQNQSADKAHARYGYHLVAPDALFLGQGVHFSEKKAMALLYKLENSTKELVALTHQIVELTHKFEEQWSQR